MHSEESEDQQQKVGPENTPKPPPIYKTDVYLNTVRENSKPTI
jgi:hypothetical protein